MEKKSLLTITAKDCDWSYTRGTGKGGQARNKTSSAVHCTHRASGAHGYAEDSRSQHANRSTAFLRMAQTKEFKNWHRYEVARITGQLADIERQVDYELAHHVKVEIVDDNGRWVAE